MAKKYIKNITGEKGTRYATPLILAYKEDGKKIELKAGEQRETKLTKSLSHRLVLVEEESKSNKKEVK